MSLRFAVVHEAEADFRTATELADWVLMEAIDWLDDEALLPGQREWVDHEAGGRRLSWKTIPQLARQAGIRAHGHFDGAPGLPDAAAARRAILYLLETIPGLGAIVLVRDQDDEPERRGGLEQARDQDRSGVAIVIGLAVVERESWVMCGFEPRDDEETARLAAERSALGSDPRLHSHELTACKDDQAHRSPKRVLRQLSGADWERERACWLGTPLVLLRQRGEGNGLTAFLNEVRDGLAPLIGHVPRE
jgi:hypothetical protein